MESSHLWRIYCTELLLNFSLLSYHTYLVSFAPEVLGPTSYEASQKFLDMAKQTHPNGAFFAFMEGRALRNQRKLDDAIIAFQLTRSMRPADIDSDLTVACWDAICNLAHYELGLTFLFKLEFEQAAMHFGILSDTGYWSPATCRYLQAVCIEAAGGDASKLFSSVKSLVQRKYGGRVINSEEYAMLYAEQSSDGWRRVLEVIAIWNGFPCMPETQRKICAEKVQGLLWVQALLYKEEKNLEKAVEILTPLAQNSDFVGSFSLYELGVIAWLQNERDLATEHWKTALERSGYFFEIRLSLRLQLALHATESS